MNRNELTQASETFIQGMLRNKLPVGTRVYLFGSRVRQNARWNADYDLWIDDEVSEELLNCFQEELEESFVPFKVDIVTTNQLQGQFGAEVRKWAKLWMCDSPDSSMP